MIIAAAGMAAHLPGVVAAWTALPVIGVPVGKPGMSGLDALLSIAQMPPGVPVACMAVNGAKNAALYAAAILALKHEGVREALAAYRRQGSRFMMTGQGHAPQIPRPLQPAGHGRGPGRRARGDRRQRGCQRLHHDRAGGRAPC